MFHANLDKLTAKMPAWDFAVTIHGVRYAVRQPTLAEDEQLANVKAMKDVQIINLMWGLFAGPMVPDKSKATRDTLTAFYTQLLLYRKARLEMQVKGFEGLLTRARSAVVAAVHPASPAAQNN